LGINDDLTEYTGFRRIDGSFKGDEGEVQLFEPLYNSKNLESSYAVKALLFPEFDSNATSSLRKLDCADVFSRLIDSGVNANRSTCAEMTEAYLKFFASLDAYQLCYSSLDQARELMLDKGLL
jgi:hypothetical protein